MSAERGELSTLKLELLPSKEEILFQIDRLLDIEIIGHAMSAQLTSCVDLLYSQDYEATYCTVTQLLDYTWEKLNTGHWKDVHVAWRHLYSFLSLVKATCELYLTEITSTNDAGLSRMSSCGDVRTKEKRFKLAIKSCDMGLLMGAPICHNVLSNMASQLTHRLNSLTSSRSISPPIKKLKSQDDVVGINKSGLAEYSGGTRQSDSSLMRTGTTTVTCPIPRVLCPSVEMFKEQYMDREQAVVLEGCMDYWPAMSDRRWSLDYIKKVAGARTVPIEVGSKYTDDSWSQRLMTVTQFIDAYIENRSLGKQVGYLAQHQLFDQVPELRNDIIVPTYCCLGNNDVTDMNAWFGPQGTISPLHFDPKHNFLAQVVGRKYLILYHRDQTPLLYPHEGILSNTSRVDVEHVDHVTFPLLREAMSSDCLLNEGDMLYIPAKHWHYVRSLTTSFSVSCWWD